MIHPLGLAAKGQVWYLVADTDAGQRTFRVDRVTAVEPTGVAVVRPPDFDLTEAWGRITAEVDEKRSPFRGSWHGRARIRRPASPDVRRSRPHRRDGRVGTGRVRGGGLERVECGGRAGRARPIGRDDRAGGTQRPLGAEVGRELSASTRAGVPVDAEGREVGRARRDRVQTTNTMCEPATSTPTGAKLHLVRGQSSGQGEGRDRPHERRGARLEVVDLESVVVDRARLLRWPGTWTKWRPTTAHRPSRAASLPSAKPPNDVLGRGEMVVWSDPRRTGANVELDPARRRGRREKMPNEPVIPTRTLAWPVDVSTEIDSPKRPGLAGGVGIDQRVVELEVWFHPTGRSGHGRCPTTASVSPSTDRRASEPEAIGLDVHDGSGANRVRTEPNDHVIPGPANEIGTTATDPSTVPRTDRRSSPMTRWVSDDVEVDRRCGRSPEARWSRGPTSPWRCPARTVDDHRWRGRCGGRRRARGHSSPGRRCRRRAEWTVRASVPGRRRLRSGQRDRVWHRPERTGPCRRHRPPRASSSPSAAARPSRRRRESGPGGTTQTRLWRCVGRSARRDTEQAATTRRGRMTRRAGIGHDA